MTSFILMTLMSGATFLFLIHISPLTPASRTTLGDPNFRADLYLLFIVFVIGLISSIILLFSQSDEEKDNQEETYAKEIIKELAKMIAQIANEIGQLTYFEGYSPHKIKSFREAYAVFLHQLSTCHTSDIQKDAAKIFLKGLGNTLVIVYTIIDVYMEQRNEIIRSKPANWEQEAEEMDEKIDAFMKIKTYLHQTHKNIENIAIKHGVNITKTADTELQYLVYADPGLISLLKRKKK